EIGPAACARVLRIGSGNLLTHGEIQEITPALRRRGLRSRRCDIALIAVAYWQGHCEPAAEIVERVLHLAQTAALRDAHHAESHLLPLVAHVDTGVPPPLGLFLADTGSGGSGFSAGDCQVGPIL